VRTSSIPETIDVSNPISSAVLKRAEEQTSDMSGPNAPNQEISKTADPLWQRARELGRWGQGQGAGLCLGPICFSFSAGFSSWKAEKQKADINSKNKNWFLERWKASFWRNKLEAEKLT
jgi:hypothetical protein